MPNKHLTNLTCVGISHHTAPLEVREPLTFSQDERNACLIAFRERRIEDFPSITELIILSTCNRLEFYSAAETDPGDAFDPEGAAAALVCFASDCKGIRPEGWADLLYHYEGVEAAEHLCRVAAGLDSMVLGEPQILGQISEAHQAAVDCGAAPHVLSSLFRTAIQAGKRAHTETLISQQPASISSIAVRLAEKAAGNLKDRQILVIGAGEMGHLAVRTLVDRGARCIWIANRTYARSRDLAERWGGEPIEYDSVPQALSQADVVITSTGSPAPILTRDVVLDAVKSRSRPLVLIDIAVPRDVHPEVREIPNVHLFNLDDLQQQLSDSLTLRANEIPRVEAIVAEEVRRFAHWMEVIPVVGELHRKAEAIRLQELERTLKHLSELTPDAQEQIELLSRSLVKKILHEPTVKLRAEAENGSLDQYMDTLKFLFGLDE